MVYKCHWGGLAVFYLFIMAPSVAQLATETVDAVQATKENIKAQEIKADNVCITFTFNTLLYFSAKKNLNSLMPGTLIPTLLPLR